MAKGKKNGKGKQKFVPIESASGKNLLSRSSDDKEGCKKSNNKNRKNVKNNINDSSTSVEKHSMTSTSDTLESSGDVSTISDSTKEDESTDTSTKFYGQSDESALDEFPIIKDNKDASNCSESEISYERSEPEEVKNGFQNLSVSSHSDESFQKSYRQFDDHNSSNEYENSRKGFNRRNQNGGKVAPKPYHHSSKFQEEAYGTNLTAMGEPQGTNQSYSARTRNTNAESVDNEYIQKSKGRIQGNQSEQHTFPKTTSSNDDGWSVQKQKQFEKRKGNDTRQYSNRFDRKNETTSQGNYRDKEANYKKTAPYENSNIEKPGYRKKVLAEAQRTTQPIVNVLADAHKSKGKIYHESVDINKDGQNLVPEKENTSINSRHSNTQRTTQPIVNVLGDAQKSKGKICHESVDINNDGQNLVPDKENVGNDSWDDNSWDDQNIENRIPVATNTSDTENNWSVYTENDSSKDMPSTTDDHFENKYPQKSKTYKDNWRIDNRKSFPSMSKHYEDTSKRYSEGNKEDRNKGNSRNRNFYERCESTDKEFKMFCDEERAQKKVEFVNVEEIQQDLFAMPKEYSLGHCVAEDMRMGSGIAVNFKREFKQMDSLLDQRQKQGGLAVLEDESDGATRYIYYLITKRESTGKPTYEKFWSSLQKMRDHIRDNGVKKLAIPRLGCGLDRLEWDRVKHMIEFLFRDVNVKITVCNFQQTEESPEKPLSHTCRVINVVKSIADIEAETTIIYLSSEDEHISSEMEQLGKKFPFLGEFKNARKRLGDVIKYENKTAYYILYGCIVRKTNKDPFQFASFMKCLSQISKNNRKDKYVYIGIQAIKDENDDLLMEKILSLMKNYLSKVDIYVCWHGDMVMRMPISNNREF